MAEWPWCDLCAEPIHGEPVVQDMAGDRLVFCCEEHRRRYGQGLLDLMG